MVDIVSFAHTVLEIEIETYRCNDVFFCYMLGYKNILALPEFGIKRFVVLIYIFIENIFEQREIYILEYLEIPSRIELSNLSPYFLTR